MLKVAIFMPSRRVAALIEAPPSADQGPHGCGAVNQCELRHSRLTEFLRASWNSPELLSLGESMQAISARLATCCSPAHANAGRDPGSFDVTTSRNVRLAAARSQQRGLCHG
jgi:hypothetical protein